MSEGELIDRQVDPAGVAWELHRRGAVLEVSRDGQPIFGSQPRGSEAALAELAMAPLKGRDRVAVILAGLGMGLTLRALLDSPMVARVDVIENCAALVGWHPEWLSALNGGALADPRVRLHPLELGQFTKRVRLGALSGLPPEGWLALVMDLDAGPDRPFIPTNRAFYSDEGLARLEALVRPGGVLALWSPQREPELSGRLHARLQSVAEVAVPVEVVGAAGLDYVYRGRRPPPLGTRAPN